MTNINFAHIRARSTSGAWINFAVFDADATTRTAAARAAVLDDLTRKARGNRLRVDQSALAFTESGRLNFYGDRNLVDYLSKTGLPNWTHRLTV